MHPTAESTRSLRPALAHRRSATPYLSVLLTGAAMGLWAGYLWPGEPTFKGQALAVLVPIAFFVGSMVFWVRLDRRPRAHGWALGFLIALGASWAINVGLAVLHGDLFTHLVWLLPPILTMVALKPPTYGEGLAALRALAWSIFLILFITLALEATGLLAQKYQPEALNDFNEANYFLPINDLLGIDGRWPGPFGHYNTTALFGALLIVLALIAWQWSSWLFVAIGSVSLLVTDGRAALGAAIVGITVLGVFTQTGPLARFPRYIRGLVGLGGLILVGSYIFLRQTGFTGREAFWPAFLDLWREAPWVGVGTSGIAVSGGITQEWGHAHNQYIDMLARNGLLGLAASLAALVIAVGLAVRASGRGCPGPLAVMATYLVSGLGDTRNDSIHPSPLLLLIVVAGMTAAGVADDARRVSPQPVAGRNSAANASG